MCVCVFAPAARVCDCVSLGVDLSPRQWELVSSQSGVTGWTCLMYLFRQEHTTTRLHSFCISLFNSLPLICFLERSTHVVLRVEFHWPAVSMETRFWVAVSPSVSLSVIYMSCRHKSFNLSLPSYTSHLNGLVLSLSPSLPFFPSAPVGVSVGVTFYSSSDSSPLILSLPTSFSSLHEK